MHKNTFEGFTIDVEGENCELFDKKKSDLTWRTSERNDKIATKWKEDQKKLLWEL